MLGRAVDDDIEILAAARRHQIVDDPAVIFEQQRIFGLHVRRGAEVAGHQRLERGVDPAAVDQQLAHVADVEQPRIFAGPEMLGDDPFILDRHLIARERHHPRRHERGARHRAGACRAAAARRPRRRRDRRCRAFRAPGSRRSDLVDFPAHHALRDIGCDSHRPQRLRLPPPSVAAPESFAPSAAPFGTSAPADTFQTVRRARSLVPERFRGRLLLRRRQSLCSAELSRAAFPEARGSRRRARALAAPTARSQRDLR